MKTIDVMFDINDTVYNVEGTAWDKIKKCRYNYVVEEYKVRSISISCNSKGEWKKSYRVQRVADGKITGDGFNFGECEIGRTLFLTTKEAFEHCDMLNNRKGVN